MKTQETRSRLFFASGKDLAKGGGMNRPDGIRNWGEAWACSRVISGELTMRLRKSLIGKVTVTSEMKRWSCGS